VAAPLEAMPLEAFVEQQFAQVRAAWAVTPVMSATLRLV